jgi:hypothetical protein
MFAATLSIVIAGLDPAIPLRDAQRPPKRDARHKAGHEDGGSADATTNGEGRVEKVA